MFYDLALLALVFLLGAAAGYAFRGKINKGLRSGEAEFKAIAGAASIGKMENFGKAVDQDIKKL